MEWEENRDGYLLCTLGTDEQLASRTQGSHCDRDFLCFGLGVFKTYWLQDTVFYICNNELDSEIAFYVFFRHV